jgi:hypothetical protein
MKSLFIILLMATALFTTNCQAQNKKGTKENVYGKSLTPEKSIAASILPTLLKSKDSVAVKVSGQVQDVCQAKGCWMDIKLTDKSVMKVRFKDYGFFVPKDIKGKTVVINGMAYNKSVSVADQRHYAQDAGKPESEIKAITQPKQNITFIADGVLVK